MSVKEIQAITLPATVDLSRWDEVKQLNAETECVAAQDYRELAGVLDRIEEQRTKLTKPLNSVVKEINAAAKARSTPIEAVRTKLKALLLGYQDKVRQGEVKRIKRKAAAAEKRGEVELARDLVRAAASTPAITGLTTKVMRAAEVTDLKALCKAIGAGKVPVDAVSPSKSWLNKQVADAERDAEVFPGVFARDNEYLSR